MKMTLIFLQLCLGWASILSLHLVVSMKYQKNKIKEKDSINLLVKLLEGTCEILKNIQEI